MEKQRKRERLRKTDRASEKVHEVEVARKDPRQLTSMFILALVVRVTP